jgi:hypothetical protein
MLDPRWCGALPGMLLQRGMRPPVVDPHARTGVAHQSLLRTLPPNLQGTTRHGPRAFPSADRDPGTREDPQPQHTPRASGSRCCRCRCRGGHIRRHIRRHVRRRGSARSQAALLRRMWPSPAGPRAHPWRSVATHLFPHGATSSEGRMNTRHTSARVSGLSKNVPSAHIGASKPPPADIFPSETACNPARKAPQSHINSGSRRPPESRPA